MKLFEDGIEVACCMDTPENCVCLYDERILRAYLDGRRTEPMTPEQRQRCIEEADHAGEGFYTEKELSDLNDQELASAVIKAWDMYVQSNCL